jgi:hypothetical protein
MQLDSEVSDAWNPGIFSQIPREWMPLATIFRRENVFGDLASAQELAGLTGFSLSELVIFRPERLALHELLIRVTADFVVPDGSRIGDLGINFRKIATRILIEYVNPEMAALTRVFEDTRRALGDAAEQALESIGVGAPPPMKSRFRLFGRRPVMAVRPSAEARAFGAGAWGPAEIAACTRRADSASEEPQRVLYRTLARVLSGLFARHGHAWGTRDLILSLARDLTCNVVASDVIGGRIEPLLRRAAQAQGYVLLPRQDRPIVINTKGASASGKSTLRPLQKKLAGEIGAHWSDFALISPDIWRKQLLDYGALGAAYKYAGALAGEELQIVDRKLDRYMARKHAAGNMSHLLIDRFRFDSFAPDSDEEGSNLLTRFGQTVYLFFVITPPEQLVERAWKRGLEFGRYKAVDDTLAHAVDAYTGIPSVFFTWVRRSDKRIQFEFLDNTVPLGERPRTVAFGDNDTVNVLDIGRMLDISRYGRVHVDAKQPDGLYLNRACLGPEQNLSFLTRCVQEFRYVNFAAQDTGRVYLHIESATLISVDPAQLEASLRDADSRAGVRAVAPDALRGLARTHAARYLPRYDAAEESVCAADPTLKAVATLGRWGEARESQSRKLQ